MKLLRIKYFIPFYLALVLLLLTIVIPSAASPITQAGEVLVYTQDFESGAALRLEFGIWMGDR